jgi:hypothetical protein
VVEHGLKSSSDFSDGSGGTAYKRASECALGFHSFGGVELAADVSGETDTVRVKALLLAV